MLLFDNSIASRAFLTNSAGYNANTLAIEMKKDPINNSDRYFQRNLFRYFKCLINWVATMIEMPKIISKFATHLSFYIKKSIFIKNLI